VGEALSQVLSEGVISRDQIFVTSKLWNSDHHRVRDACLKTLSDLQVRPVQCNSGAHTHWWGPDRGLIAVVNGGGRARRRASCDGW
jgi:diketogulonate reductase-like aldo/keto reductase